MNLIKSLFGYGQELQNISDIATLDNITSDDITQTEETDIGKSCDMWNKQMEAATRLDEQGLLRHDGKTWRGKY